MPCSNVSLFLVGSEAERSEKDRRVVYTRYPR